MSYLRALNHRPFALLWTAQTISQIGDFLYQITLVWWVVEQTGSAAVMGTVLLCAVVPMLVFALLGGVIVDRLPRVRLMIASELAMGLIATVITVLAATGQLAIWHVCVTSVLFGILDAFFQPAYTALVPEIVPPEALSSANALTSLSMQLGRVVGPLLGAAILTAGGTTIGFAIDAASFWLSAAILLPLGLRATRRPAPSEPNPPVLRDLREGLMLLLGMPWLWISILAFALINVTLVGPFQVALPFLVDQHFGADERVLGLLYAAFPIGYILGGLWLGRVSRIRHRGWLLHSGLAVAGLGMLALGFPIGLIGLLVAAVINGAGLEMSSMAWMTALQERVPNERLGRVASIELLLSGALIPLGLVLAGWGTSALGPANVCMIGGAMTIAVAGLSLSHPAVRRVD